MQRHEKQRENEEKKKRRLHTEHVTKKHERPWKISSRTAAIFASLTLTVESSRQNRRRCAHHFKPLGQYSGQTVPPPSQWFASPSRSFELHCHPIGRPR